MFSLDYDICYANLPVSYKYRYRSKKLALKLKAGARGTSWFWGTNEFEGARSKVDVAVALFAWYVKNRGMRRLAMKSQLALKIRELVVEVVEDAILPLDNIDVNIGAQRTSEDNKVLREHLQIGTEEDSNSMVVIHLFISLNLTAII